jgi:putative bacteriocin precursor
MRKLGKNVNPVKETVEAYWECTGAEAWCYANCYGDSVGQSYARQYANFNHF